MSEEMLLTPEERLGVFSDSIISSIIGKDALSLKNRQVLFGQISPKIFRDENFVIYTVLYNFKENHITPDTDFLKMYLLRNESLMLKAKEYININAYAELDENPVVGYTTGVIKNFERFKTMQCLDAEDFKLTLEKFKIEFKNTQLGEVMSKSRAILYDGLQVGNKYFQGYEDSLAYLKKGSADIEALVSTTCGEGFIDASEYGLRDDAETKPEKIGDFGEIKELTKIYGGYYTGLFYSIMAPTKTGKSKFTARAIHNIAVEHGNNAVVWSHEGGHDLWLAQYRAIHFDYTYNRNEGDVTKMKVGVDQNAIFTGDYPSEAIKELEAASRVDLFTNTSYGNVHLIDRPFNVETFIDEIETAVQLNNAKVVLIDYLQLIGSAVRGANKSEVIGKAYQLLLAYAKKRKIMVMSPAQFTQDFIKDTSSKKSMTGVETRTAGGESSEIVRSPDINIGLYASIEDLQNNRMTILSVPSRLGKTFIPIEIYCDLGTCMFSSLDFDESLG